MVVVKTMAENGEVKKQQQRTQEEVQERFCPILKRDGKVYRKKQTAYLRPAKKGEKITTEIDGVHETDNTVKDDTSRIACGKKGEQYILTQANFEESYDETSGTLIDEAKVGKDGSAPVLALLERLARDGFKEYSSKRSVYAHAVDADDMSWLSYNNADGEQNQKVAYFMAPWGEPARVEMGDVLVMKYPDDNPEVYRIEKNVFGQSYTPRQL